MIASNIKMLAVLVLVKILFLACRWYLLFVSHNLTGRERETQRDRERQRERQTESMSELWRLFL